MLHYRFARKLILIAAALLAVGAVSAVALTPAISGEVRPLLQSLAIITCSSPSPCQEGKNTGTGPGLEGISAKGKGVIGQTTFNSTSTSNGQAGVQGQDLSTSGSNDSGVKGTSTRGTGVSASSSSGNALVGKSINGLGLSATSVNGRGADIRSQTFDGILGVTSNATKTTHTGASGVAGSDFSSDGGHLNSGVTGAAFYGIGVTGLSIQWVGVNAVGGFANVSAGETFPALSIVGNMSGGAFDDLIDACIQATANPCDNLHSVFRVDGTGGVDAQESIGTSGSFVITGTGVYAKNGTCVAGCTAATSASTGRAVATYASMASQPTIEDFGEAQLVSGQASVHLDPKFANVVDQRANYLVFVTPEGDANLYVTQKTPNGFLVRETHGGRSTIAFDYRIVAKPFGSRDARLPMVEIPRLRHPGLPTHTRPLHFKA